MILRPPLDVPPIDEPEPHAASGDFVEVILTFALHGIALLALGGAGGWFLRGWLT